MVSKIHRRIERKWKTTIELSEYVEEGEGDPEAIIEKVNLISYLEKFNIKDDDDKLIFQIAIRTGVFFVKNKKSILAIVALIAFASSVITIYQSVF